MLSSEEQQRITEIIQKYLPVALGDNWFTDVSDGPSVVISTLTHMGMIDLHESNLSCLADLGGSSGDMAFMLAILKRIRDVAH